MNTMRQLLELPEDEAIAFLLNLRHEHAVRTEWMQRAVQRAVTDHLGFCLQRIEEVDAYSFIGDLISFLLTRSNLPRSARPRSTSAPARSPRS